MSRDLDKLGTLIAETAIKVVDKKLEGVSKEISEQRKRQERTDANARHALNTADTVKSDIGSDLERHEQELGLIKDLYGEYLTEISDAVQAIHRSQQHLDEWSAEKLKAVDHRIESVAEMTTRETHDLLLKTREARRAIWDRLTQMYSELREAKGQVDTLFSSIAAAPDEFLEELDAFRTEYRLSFDDLDKRVSESCQELNEQDSRYKELEDVILARYDQKTKEIDEKFTEMVSKLHDGAKGDPGKDGPRGPKGDAGTMVSPEAWVEGKLYRPGDVATHRGGTWYAEIKCVDEPGTGGAWTCIANGVDTEGCYFEKGELNIVMSDGQSVSLKAVPQWNGVYETGMSVPKGDMVTSNGSLYKALVDNPQQAPGKKLADGEESEWGCLVKRGARGQRGAAGDISEILPSLYSRMEKDLEESEIMLAEYLNSIEFGV